MPLLACLNLFLRAIMVEVVVVPGEVNERRKMMPEVRRT